MEHVEFDMTLGEAEEFEDITGHSFFEISEGSMRARDMTALTYLQLRRTNPDATLDDARCLSMSEAAEMMSALGGATDPE